tara:strand:- start:400 stop:591 length:192 start_codon:yes stop_codon:yes gene_type:complete
MFEIDAVNTRNLQRVLHLEGQSGQIWAILLVQQLCLLSTTELRRSMPPEKVLETRLPTELHPV